jgi:hypothetical protein
MLRVLAIAPVGLDTLVLAPAASRRIAQATIYEDAGVPDNYIDWWTGDKPYLFGTAVALALGMTLSPCRRW